jgi:hypothetical protein
VTRVWRPPGDAGVEATPGDMDGVAAWSSAVVGATLGGTEGGAALGGTEGDDA